MQIQFHGKRALVTGAGKGIGRVIATMLTSCGAEVIALSRTRADLDSLASEIGCQTLQADIGDPIEAEKAAKQAGAIDLLINNAGVSIPQPFLNTSLEAFEQTMSVNLRAVLIISQTIARGMVQRGQGGAIVNLSSQASKVALTDHAAYCASKGALDQLTRVMALELGMHQIRVNALNPTVTLTPMGEVAWSDPEKRNGMLSQIPLGRFAKPIDIANAVVFLLSDQAEMIHGVTLPVDGGFLAN
ncbi:glucose 1-dehydrogenase [Bythopirellula goksoeyrii]|uniref:Gluconate 5-dehydrogenase n=1 Tax=Bythopirellula goksoeyrii TaxID=1400387 RepID=A0A5B9Q888_9BACT|nr:glucose 1-dehydrogenase [Bythopirellula goksoeyrii]QEG33940.1 Gluconate 5-dehydrogenase [Bythopirellula goksoeyrii]